MRDRLKSSVAALSSRANGSSVVKDAGVELSEERTYKLPQIRDWGGGYKSAEFVIALTKESGVADTKFLSGAQELRGASAAMGALKSGFPFPDDSHARVVRRGVLSCSELAKGCVFVFYPALAQPPVAPPNADPVVVPKTNPDEVRFEIPKNFTVTADTSGRGLVLMIVNHRLENQNGYAFSPDAAKQVAGGLIKSADAALALKSSATEIK